MAGSDAEQLAVASGTRAATPNGRLAGIQILRAVAALAVVFAHVPNSLTLTEYAGYGAVGVDIFFVISGFIIVYSSRDLFTTANGWLRFLCRRLTRIVPLYWSITTVAVTVSLLSHPEQFSHFFDPSWIASTYLFLPFDGREPMVAVGWTLNFEMLFYVVFAGLIWLRSSSAVLAVSILFGFAAALHRLLPGLPPPWSIWSNPIIGEFVLGAGLALIYLRGIRISPVVAIGLISVGVTGFAVAAACGYYAVPINDPTMPRSLVWGVPALALVAAPTLSRSPLGMTRLARLGTRLGEASYSIYLIHTVVIYVFLEHFEGLTQALLFKSVDGMAKTFRQPVPTEMTKIVMAAAAECVGLMVVISVISMAIFVLFERPVMAYLRRRLEPGYRPTVRALTASI
jgi:exopolysaccharide production protein ExoZ